MFKPQQQLLFLLASIPRKPEQAITRMWERSGCWCSNREWTW